MTRNLTTINENLHPHVWRVHYRETTFWKEMNTTTFGDRWSVIITNIKDFPEIAELCDVIAEKACSDERVISIDILSLESLGYSETSIGDLVKMKPEPTVRLQP